MIDITTARQVDYRDSQGLQLQVTVFQDRENKGLWAMVPVPRLRIDGGQPTFNLTKYTSNGSAVAGTCTFEVELFAPEEAKRAAEQQIPGITGWEQFTWTSGNVFFDFEWPVDGTPAGQQVTVTPSLFGSNTARFQIELATEEALNTFIGAFTGDGKVSPFSITYEMGVLTQLLGATATIKYKASAAIEYERKYKTTKDTWGKSHSVLAETKQNLKSSGAGDVTVTKGAGGSNELVQFVRDWAWSTLEKQVADAIDNALRQAEGNQNPISVVSDINTTYSEDTIVEWSTPVSRFLPRFDAQTWSKVYHEVDNRQLVVTFELVGDPTNADGKAEIQDVEVTVNYPTRPTDNTFKLSLAKDGKTSETYIAPGEGRFNPEFEYKYVVNFPGGQPPYTSGWIQENATRVSLRPSQFGIRKISFIGSDVPFQRDGKPLVKKIFVDFFEKPPQGQKPKLQTQELLANGLEGKVEFNSTYHTPITNTYDYRLRYQLENGDVITVQPGEKFGSANADQVFIPTPQAHLTSFDLRALVGKAGDGFLAINANAAYFDKQNSSQPNPPNFNWDGWVPEPQPGLSASPTWTFQAQPDPQTAYFQLNGQVLYGDGSDFTLADVNVPYSRRALILKDAEEIYSVKIFTDAIDWKQVAQVTMNIFQLFGEEGNVLAEQVEIPGEYLRAVRAQSQPNFGAGARETRNLIPYNILPPAPDQPARTLPLYYTLYRPRSAASIVFYYNAEYVLNDGTVKGTGQLEVTDKLQIHLPPVAQGPSGQIHSSVVELAEARVLSPRSS